MPGESAKSSKTRLQSEDTDRTKADSAENRAHPIMAKALSGLTGDVIVLGGYCGSRDQPSHHIGSFGFQSKLG